MVLIVSLLFRTAVAPGSRSGGVPRRRYYAAVNPIDAP